MTESSIDDDLSFTRQDFLLLTKARLSALVIVTTIFGYLLAVKSAGVAIGWWDLTHTVIGSALAAAAASVFNQLMELILTQEWLELQIGHSQQKKFNQPSLLLLAGYWLHAESFTSG